MKKTKPYRSPLMASIHETAEGLHAAGLMNKLTMRKFDAMCLTPIPRLKPKQIRDLRLREGASQAVFARYSSHRAPRIIGAGDSRDRSRSPRRRARQRRTHSHGEQ